MRSDEALSSLGMARGEGMVEHYVSLRKCNSETDVLGVLKESLSLPGVIFPSPEFIADAIARLPQDEPVAIALRVSAFDTLRQEQPKLAAFIEEIGTETVARFRGALEEEGHLFVMVLHYDCPLLTKVAPDGVLTLTERYGGSEQQAKILEFIPWQDGYWHASFSPGIDYDDVDVLSCNPEVKQYLPLDRTRGLLGYRYAGYEDCIPNGRVPHDLHVYLISESIADPVAACEKGAIAFSAICSVPAAYKIALDRGAF